MLRLIGKILASSSRQEAVIKGSGNVTTQISGSFFGFGNRSQKVEMNSQNLNVTLIDGDVHVRKEGKTVYKGKGRNIKVEDHQITIDGEKQCGPRK